MDTNGRESDSYLGAGKTCSVYSMFWDSRTLAGRRLIRSLPTRRSAPPRPNASPPQSAPPGPSNPSCGHGVIHSAQILDALRRVQHFQLYRVVLLVVIENHAGFVLVT